MAIIKEGKDSTKIEEIEKEQTDSNRKIERGKKLIQLLVTYYLTLTVILLASYSLYPNLKRRYVLIPYTMTFPLGFWWYYTVTRAVSPHERIVKLIYGALFMCLTVTICVVTLIACYPCEN